MIAKGSYLRLLKCTSIDGPPKRQITEPDLGRAALLFSWPRSGRFVYLEGGVGIAGRA